MWVSKERGLQGRHSWEMAKLNPHGAEGRCGVPSPSHPPGQEEEEAGTAARLLPGAQMLGDAEAPL